MTLKLEIDCREAPVVARRLKQVAHRVVEYDRALPDVMEIFEEAHERHFRRVRGRYVRTGATRESLTAPAANGAIREIHNGELRFGTDIWYAHFLTKAPKDPEGGQVPKGRSGKGRSAVLVMPRGIEKKVGRKLLDFIVEPVE